jgi:hypothetical protein
LPIDAALRFDAHALERTPPAGEIAQHAIDRGGWGRMLQSCESDEKDGRPVCH